MKLRIQDNSVRLRLRRSEVDDLARDGKVEAQAVFSPGSALRYSLESADGAAPEVTFRDSTVRVRVPKQLAEAWAAGDEVGITGEYLGISILVERDFQRTNVKSKIDHDLYPNPRSGGAKT